MKTMWKFSWVFVLFVAVIIGLWFSFSQNVNTLGIIPPSQTPTISAWERTNTYTWRYFCPINISVEAIYGWWSGFGNCQYSLKFDPTYANLQYISKWTAFWQTDNAIFTGNGSILFVEEKHWNAITDTVECSKLRVTAINPSQNVVNLSFVRADGNPLQIPYDFTHTMPDLLNLAWWGTDTLTWIQNLAINLYACPCTLDNNRPTISNWTVWGDALNTNKHYQWSQTVKFLVYDKWWTSRQYWTQWTHDFSNYTGAWVPSNMDNQEWIDRNSIVVNLYSWSELIKSMPAGDSALTITEYDWSNNIPKFTWDGNIRWYWVSFDTDFVSVETPITIEVLADDNALVGDGPCQTSAHRQTSSNTLNQREAPVITFNLPVQENANPDAWVMLTVSDAWAWVDTGSLIVEILPVMSWSQVVMSWSVYSWSDLTFQLIAGSGVLWWASKYEVTFQPRYEFPVGSTIRLSGYVEDLVWVSAHKEYTFTTRQDCTFYGCVNFVDIFFWDIWYLILNWFTWSLIVITGTIADYPYLTWENGDIVMCGPINDSINLTWNIDIYSGSEIINWSAYPYRELYVTGLDFEYQDSVITPRY